MDEPKELGTLIVVVGKARNLVNKSRFGKQDPFCTVSYNEDKQKTKPIKRGGQHPEWDEELRFTIIEDADDLLARSQSVADSLTSSTTSSSPKVDSPGVTTAQALATKSRKGPIGKKGGKALKIACYADDPKEPELIGDCAVPIDEVLKKGEVDEWYDINYKEKYSGEIYLELTFYSNDAPPVKRNVPRPPINNYGGAGVFEAGSSSSRTQHRLSGGITSSGSVSGMSLYIPPYVKPADVNPAVPPSSSFQNLGVPPVQRQHTPLPGQPSYPQSHTPQPFDNLAVDALSRPLSSLSLSSNASASRPLPVATPAPGQHHGHHPHRHSVGGPNEAPWGSLLPQSLPPPAPAPHPRPQSTNDAVAPWDHSQRQRIEDERRMGGATPVPRPVSGSGYRPPWQAQQPVEPYRGRTPVPGVPAHHHSNSFSGPSQSHLTANPYPPTPEPALHSSSAPPVPPSNHYNMPSTSFGGIAQSVMEPHRPPTAQPGYMPTSDPYQQQQQTYQPPIPQQHSYSGTTQQYNTPPRHDPYSHRHSLPNPSTLQSPPPPTPPRDDSYSQQGYNPPTSDYGYSQQPQSNGASQPPVASNSSGYVPWYQQTQNTAPSQQPYQPSSTPQTSSYSSYPSTAPPIPNQRPIPNPPAPPKNPEGYWYPSDELYNKGQSQQQPSRPPSSAPQDGRPPSTTPAYAIQQSSAGYVPPYPTQIQYTQPNPTPAPYSPQPNYGQSAPPAPPKRDSLSWQSNLQPLQEQPQSQYGRAPSPAPPPLTQYYGGSPSPAPQQQQYYNSQPNQPYRTPSPQPPSQPQQAYIPPHQPQQSYRAPSPQPPYRAPSPQPPQSYRALSPQPQHSSQSQPAYHAPSPQHLQQPWSNSSSTTTHLGAPTSVNNGYSTSASPSPSPGPNGQSKAKQDWRSYMQAISTPQGQADPNAQNGNPGAPGRSPSPAPPPKDWYTPPPNLPSSIRPPDGWRSTVGDQNQWGR